MMLKSAVRIAVAVVWLGPLAVDAVSQTPAGPSPTGPQSAGSTRVAMRNPAPENWACKRGVCECKPNVCPASSVVSYAIRPSKVRSTDPKVLENFARTEGPKSLRPSPSAQGTAPDGNEKYETVSTKVSRHQGLLNVVSETKITKDKRSEFIAKAMMFSGIMLISIDSRSPDRALAMKSLNEFVSGITVN